MCYYRLKTKEKGRNFMNPLMDDRRVMLEKYSISDLRVLGRNMSIKSPTSLSKKELVEEILKMMFGPEYYESETRGRDYDEEEEEIELDDAFCYKKIDLTEFSTVKLSSNFQEYQIIKPSDVFEYELEKEDRFELKEELNDLNLKQNLGFIEKEEDKTFLRFSNSDRKIELSPEQIKLHNFSPYDNVVFTSVYSPFQNQTKLLDVLSINGIKGLKKPDFLQVDKLKSVPPTLELEFGFGNAFLNVVKKATGLPKGARVLTVGDDFGYKARMVMEISKTFQEKEIATFLLALDYPKEVKTAIENADPNATFVGTAETPEFAMDKILTAFFRAQKMVEAGQQVVMILDGLDGLFDRLESLITDENKNYITTISNKFFNVGGCYDNGGSITIFAFVGTKNMRLLERARNSATIVVPIDDDLVKQKAYPAVDLLKIENKLASFYMDEDSKTVAEDIKKVVESKGKNKYAEVVKTLRSIKGTKKEQIIEKLYNL